MGSILRPYSRRMLPPFQRLKVDPSHPLASNLVACYVPGIAGGIDLASGSLDLSLSFGGNDLFFDTGQEGPILNSAVAATAGMFSPALSTNSRLRTFSSLTLYWRGVTPASGTALAVNSRNLGIEYDNAFTSPFVVAAIQVNTNTDPYTFQAIWNAAGVGAGSGASSPSVTANKLPFSIATSFKPGGNVVSYKDGVSYDTTAFGAAAPNFTATSFLQIMSLYGARGSGLGTMAAYAFDRDLSASEIAALDADPYGMLIPVEGEMPALFAGDLPAGLRFQQQPIYNNRALPQPSPSLNLNLLKNPIPSNQTEWPQSFRVPHITPDGSFALNTNLFKNPLPNNQQDWSYTRRLWDFLPDVSVPLNLNLFKNPIPNNQFDWSRPVRQLPLPAPIQAYNNALYTVVVVAAPFNQTDWAVPQRLKALPLPPDALNTNLFTNPVPLNQFDWLKPFPVPLALAQPSPPLNINIFTNPIPFAQFDWARPVRLPPLPPVPDTLNGNLFTPFPFSQTDWSKPQQIKITQPRPAEGINLNLFTNPIPFANLDRTIPLALRGPPDQTLPYNLNLYGVVTVSVPFNQMDWQIPQRARFLTPPPHPINPNLLFTNPVPFAQFEYPLQRRVPASPTELSRALNQNLFANPIPFAQYDWSPGRQPLPRLGDNPANFTVLVSVAPAAPLEEHSKPFFATPGRLMGM